MALGDPLDGSIRIVELLALRVVVEQLPATLGVHTTDDDVIVIPLDEVHQLDLPVGSGDQGSHGRHLCSPS